MKNNTMVSFREIIENCFNQYDVYIPLIQRNYKWNTSTAAKLAADLWNAYQHKLPTYTVGMITFFEEPQDSTNSKTKTQLIDGQQRIITLFILLQFLKSKRTFSNTNAASPLEFDFRFERDDGVSEDSDKRQTYLKNIASSVSSNSSISPDKKRFQYNFEAIQTKLEEQAGFLDQVNSAEQIDPFINYIGEHLYFLLHITPNTPLSEFLNINKNKTRFVVSDKIKAHLIIDSKTNDDKAEVLELFQSFSKILFSNDTIWELISRGYIEDETPATNDSRVKNLLYPDENRLKLLCCDCYGDHKCDVQNISGYEYQKELSRLRHLHNILQELEEDIAQNDWHSSNGFACLHDLDCCIRFFCRYKTQHQDNVLWQPKYFLDGSAHLEDYLLHAFKGLQPFTQQCFIETQLSNEKQIDYDFKTQFEDIEHSFPQSSPNNSQSNQSDDWVYTGQDDLPAFQMIYQNYIQEKYKEM